MYAYIYLHLILLDCEIAGDLFLQTLHNFDFNAVLSAAFDSSKRSEVPRG